MKITLITVGKIKEKYIKDAIAEYSKRLSRYCRLEIHEVADEKTPENASEATEASIRQKEGKRILNLLKEDAYIITLEIEGRMLDSIELADKIEPTPKFDDNELPTDFSSVNSLTSFALMHSILFFIHRVRY